MTAARMKAAGGFRIGERRLAVAAGRVELDRALDQHVQKVRPLALVHERHALRKSLQVSGLDQGLEVSILHAAEQRQRTHDVGVGKSHDVSLPACTAPSIDNSQFKI